MIRVMIVDDQEVVCEGLRVMLNLSPNIEVVGVAYNGAQLLDMLPHLGCDLVLMDLRMPQMNGVQATRAVRAQYPGLPVLVLTTYDDDDWVLDAIRAGAAGYLLKDTPRADLIAAIEGTIAGRTHIDPGVADKLVQVVRQGAPPDQAILAALTEREIEILRLIGNGLTNAAIADRLHLAEGTVRNHVSSIFSKLEVSDRSQATAIAWKNGLMSYGA